MTSSFSLLRTVFLPVLLCLSSSPWLPAKCHAQTPSLEPVAQKTGEKHLRALEEAFQLVQEGENTAEVLTKAIHLYERHLIEAKLNKKKTLFYLNDLARAYLRLGAVLQKKDAKIDAFEKGISTSRKAQKLDDQSGEAVFWGVANLASQGATRGIIASAWQLNDVFSELNRALELDPKHSYARETLARVYHAVPGFMGGSDEKAFQALRRCLEDDPFFTPCTTTLARIHLARSEPQKAKKHLLAVLQAKKSSVPADFRKFNRPEARQMLASLQEK